MEVLLNDKITMRPVCLVQGEHRATTISFSLPAVYGGQALDGLYWQVRATSIRSLTFQQAALAVRAAPDGRFALPWLVENTFTTEAGPLRVTLCGTQGDAVVAKFVVEGIAVAENEEGEAAPEKPQDYFELVILRTGENASAALTALAGAENACASAKKAAAVAAEGAQTMERCAAVAQESVQQALDSAARAAASAEQAAAGGSDMARTVYDPDHLASDLYALLHGMTPVYEGRSLSLCAGAGRVESIGMRGDTLRGGVGVPSLQNPRPLQGIGDAGLVVNGQAVALELEEPLYSLTHTQTGEVLRDERRMDGAEEHNLALLCFDGSENFQVFRAGEETTEFATDAIGVATLANNGMVPFAMCSHFEAPMAPDVLWNARAPGFSASYRILLRTRHATVGELKAWLAEQHAAGTPLQVLYLRDEPLALEKGPAGPDLSEGRLTVQATGQNARARVQLKRVYQP